ncbi:hypothetical protein RB595_010120 [Gaeumannomyces hyphopodioides]
MTTDRGLDALAHLHLPRDGTPPRAARPIKKPIYTFDSIDQYENTYRSGTEFEMSLEQGIVDNFNKAEHVFPTWVVCRLRNSDGRQQWIYALKADNKLEGFPKPGDRCMIAINNNATGRDPASREWSADRIELPHGSLKTYAVFRVSMPAHIATETILKPVMDTDCTLASDTLDLNDSEMTYSMITLDEYEDVTSKAELGALDTLIAGVGEDSERARQVFDWIRTFKDPAFNVNLFDDLPHMRNHIDNPDALPPKLKALVERLNPLQKAAFIDQLANLPCGVGIIPGGPGGGKTFFNMLITAIAQASLIDFVDKDGNRKQRHAKVLYLLDINSPVDDATNKCVKISEDLGDDKKIVRMFGWGREYCQGLKSRKETHKAGAEAGAAVEADDDNVHQHAMADNFLLQAQMAANDAGLSQTKTSCCAPTLDQVAFQRFAGNKAEYPELEELLQGYLSNPCFDKMRELRDETYTLYRDSLDEVDFVASTPVAAVNLAGGKYMPDIVLFDEAPHARELANLIAIAHFQPMAWIFTGDFRQTGCFLGSMNKNPWETQMKMSVMERAHHANAIKHELLMNHRAYGWLHKMPSAIFYNNRMVSGISNDDMLPPSTRYLRTWLGRFTSSLTVYIPRLIVHQLANQSAVQVAKSWYHPGHQAWVLERCKELMTDRNFLSVDGGSPGSILIIAPYREAFLRYKRAVEKLDSELREQIREKVHRHLTYARSADSAYDSDGLGSASEFSAGEERDAVVRIEELEKSLPRIEARTIDRVQGHEADVVFIDLVRGWPSPFLDDPKRLAVATTRARQAEIYMMPTQMADKVPTKTTYLRHIFESCRNRSEGLRAWV